MPPGDMWQYPKAFLVVTTGGRVQVEARGAAQDGPSTKEEASALQRGQHDRHTRQPTSRTILSVPGAGGGEAPEAETTGFNRGVAKGTRYSGMGLLHVGLSSRLYFLHEPHIFLGVKSCRAPVAAWPAGSRSPAPTLLGCFLSEFPPPSPDCVASRLFLALLLTAGLIQRPGP